MTHGQTLRIPIGHSPKKPSRDILRICILTMSVLGEEYETLRLTLVKFFDWRGARFPEECADETFNRAARKIDSAETVREIGCYCHGINPQTRAI